MTAAIAVSCLINRQWDVAQKSYTGQWVNGELIDISSTSDRDGNIHPVGVVVLENGHLESIAPEFIKKI